MESFAKKLASSGTSEACNRFVLLYLDGSIRDKAFKALRTWLAGRCTDLSYKEYLRLWKALFYCLWMADKPSYQETLAKRLGELWVELHGKSPAAGLLYVQAFWETLCREWPGIDRHRLDKYYLLLKSFISTTLTLMVKEGFEESFMESINKLLMEYPLHPTMGNKPDALKLYMMENFFSLLESANGDGALSRDATLRLMAPFIAILQHSPKKPVQKACEKMILECPLLDKPALSSELFEIGAMKETEDVNRRLLYSLSKALKN